MLIGNGARLCSNPMRTLSGVGVVNNTVGHFPVAGSRMNQSIGFGKLSSSPRGTQPPYAWIRSKKSGDLSSRSEIIGGGGLSSNMDLGINLTANPDGAGSFSGDMGLLVLLSATLAGSGSITSATIESILQMTASLLGSGGITSTNLDCLAWMSSFITGDGGLSGNMRCDCYMDAEITSAGEVVTAQSCAQAVWSALAASFNEPGTTGNKLNSASAAGDPWTAELPGSYTEGSAGATLANMDFLVKILVNRREIKKVGQTWTLVVYDDDGTTPILSKELKDVTGNQISDLAGGILAREEPSSV